ncbi:malate:quinone oxidoreductase [Metabacillus sp. CT-WN-B3]|uniref:Malate:quinone oxidoreductase n=1 Tax=Metabacillus hrfriensis TaxID=3048891 RepID=A0ACD4RJ03_9BACI|nr:malate:quinone oxidoreductase [Metabacillus sp. CT-WN-B3]WHZ60376.1 malate:quinone oxidoreductase [Metabacillus sp. CT-WN-B3]
MRGASRGASAAILLEVFNRCFRQHMTAWAQKIKEIIPSYCMSLADIL